METEMPENPKVAIGECPNEKCNAQIYSDHLYSWCRQCGDPLSESVLSQLPELQKIKATVAVERDRQNNLGDRQENHTDRQVQRSVFQTIAQQDEVIEGDYLVVPFVGRINTGFLSTQNAGTVSRQLQTLINRHAQQGWEFHSITKVSVEVAPGCLALFGATTSYVTFDQVIFRRARQDSLTLTTQL
jgi:hypothetical protein